jgi:DNA-binding transcriptional LysR family regulator
MISLGPIDSQLEGTGRMRHIAVSAPEFGVVPFIMAQNDLMFTTGRPFAEHLASIGPFRILAAPVELEPMRFHMLWHERQHRAPTHKWLRNIVRETAEELQKSAPFQPVRMRPAAAKLHAA